MLKVKIFAHDRCISTMSDRLIERLGNVIDDMIEPPKRPYLITF
jgi:hypothetical protein